MRPILAAMALMFAGTAGSAEVEVGTATSIINQLLKYSDANPGGFGDDLVLVISDPNDAAVCRGAFISRSDAQYADILQMAITAQASGSPVRVLAESTVVWTGSSDRFCYLTTLILR